MATSEIKKFWEQSASGEDRNRYGGHSDPNITELENWYLLSYVLKASKPRYLLDVGCGKGDRTKLLSAHVSRLTLGLDYSERMISLAKKHESGRLKFRTADILREPAIGFTPDVIVSCRCLINLGTEKNVIKVLDFFHKILRRRGRLVLMEASEEGHSRLNELRRELGLEEIKTAWYNINLNEKLLEAHVARDFEIKYKTHFGLYYLLTRGFYPAAIAPETPDPTSRINVAARNLQERLGLGVLEEFGRHYCAVFQKK